MEYQNYLMHFNPNHDPRNGQFAKGHGGNSITRAEVNAGRKILKAGKKAKQNITSDRGKKVLKIAAIGGLVGLGLGVARTAAAHAVIKLASNGEYGVALNGRTIAYPIMRAGRTAIAAGLGAVGYMKIKDIQDSRKRRRNRGE